MMSDVTNTREKGAATPEKKHVFDKPKNVKRVLWGLFVSLVVVFFADLVIHKHPYFAWEKWFGFYAIYGFVACVLLVLAARFVLRPVVKRDEDYYE